MLKTQSYGLPCFECEKNKKIKYVNLINTHLNHVVLITKKRRNRRMKEKIKDLPHEGLESMQYSKPWSWSIGGWVISSGLGAAISLIKNQTFLQEFTQIWKGVFFLSDEFRKVRKNKTPTQLTKSVFACLWPNVVAGRRDLSDSMR